MWVQTAPCGACPQCRFGHENLCERLFDDIALGAYADHIVLPRRVVERNAFRKPETLSYIEAAFLEPLACVVHGWNVIKRANAAQPLPDSVAIIGAGTIGMLFLIVVKQAKIPATVFARRDDRKELATRLGAVDFQSTDSATFGRTQHETPTFGRTQHDGTKFDAVIESAGSPETWTQAIALARPGGRILLFGGLPGGTQVPIDAERLHYEELTLLGSFHFAPADVGSARDLLVSGAVDVKPLISGVESLAAVAAVFQRLDRHEGYKFALLPEGSGSGWI
jgi:L-iditol 2-dehydrogenase